MSKIIRTSEGQVFDLGDFEQWFLAELERWSGPQFISGQEHIWSVVKNYLEEQSGLFSKLTADQLSELKRGIFELGIHTSGMVGVAPSKELQVKLKKWGWSDKEILGFLGWAYRVAVIKAALGARAIENFTQLLRIAQSHPLSEAERQAIEIAGSSSMDDLEPVLDLKGNLIEGKALEEEKHRLRALIVEGIEKRKHPLVVAREMYKLEKSKGIIRDFESIAQTEIASAFAKGSFRADRLSGKFKDKNLVYRIPRPQGCEVCLALYTNSDGTPRLYRVGDVEKGVTPLISVGEMGQKFYRAVIGSTHENCLCSPWMKYWGEYTQKTFKEFAPRYVEARRRYRLDPS